MAVNPATANIAKERAEAHFTAGRYAEALATYEKIEEYVEKDPRVYLRMGDIARKINNNSRAIEYYKAASESFIKLGFIIKAIAVCKMIINIDPSQQDVHEKLATLYGAKAPQAPTQRPAPPAPAPEKQEAPLIETPPQEIEPEPEIIRLPRTPLFSDFNESEFLEVVKKVRARELKKGEYVFYQGDPGDSIFVIAEGEVEISGRAKDGSGVTVAVLKDGAIFGEFGFFHNSRRTMDVFASADSTVLELTKADLDEIIPKHPRVEEVLFNFYKERVADRLMALSDIFRPMSEADRKEILSRVTLKRLLRQSVIVKEGEKGDTMYLIKTGKVSVWVKDKSGSESKVTDLEEGDFFGEIALATTKPRVATIKAETNVELVEFSRPMIKDVLIKYPAVKEVLERVIKERVIDAIRAKERGVLV